MRAVKVLVLVSTVAFVFVSAGLILAQNYQDKSQASESSTAQAPVAQAQVSTPDTAAPQPSADNTAAAAPAQDNTAVAQGTQATAAAVQTPALSAATPEAVAPGQTLPAEPETQWLWGDVVSVEAQNNELTVKYLDYETDNEKEVKVGINDKTTFNNLKSLSEIKVNDTVSVDYILSAEGKFIAKNINIEKPEEPQAKQPSTDMSNAPAQTTPITQQ